MAENKRETSTEVAYRRILRKIIDERLAPGTPLRENVLCAEFQLSATPIREAFRKLEHEGWLQNLPYRGCFLREYTPEEVEELFIMRESVEVIAVRRALERATPDDMATIERALAQQRRHLENEQRGVSSAESLPATSADIDFHDAIVQASHSPTLLRRNNSLRAQIGYVILLTSRRPAQGSDLADTLEEHSMVYYALRRKWGDAAELLIRRHIRGGLEKYLESGTPR